MGNYLQGILGPFNGKVVTVVGSSWRGISYMRALASHVKNPNTDSQVKVRAHLSSASKLLRKFLPCIQSGFLNTGENSPWSACLQYNWDKFSYDSGSWEPDLDSIALSNGSAEYSVKAITSGSSADFTWKAPVAGTDFYGGNLYVAGYNSANGKAVIYIADLTAATLSADFSSIVTGVDDDLHVYYFVASRKASTATLHKAL